MRGWCAFYWNAFLFFYNFWGYQSFLCPTDTPVLDFWWRLLWVSKPWRIPLLTCFVVCVQLIPQIHLWCDTCWSFDDQHGSRAALTRLLIQTFVFVFNSKTMSKTRLHSSRMRTTRLLAVSRSIQGGICRGVSAWGGVSKHPMGQTSPLWTESQTGVKTLPAATWFADGKVHLY